MALSCLNLSDAFLRLNSFLTKMKKKTNSEKQHTPSGLAVLALILWGPGQLGPPALSLAFPCVRSPSVDLWMLSRDPVSHHTSAIRLASVTIHETAQPQPPAKHWVYSSVLPFTGIHCEKEGPCLLCSLVIQ